MLEESVKAGIPRDELEIREINYAYGSELEPPDQTVCPLCDSMMIHKEYKGTHIWSCEDCPAVLFEFYDAGNLVELSRYLLNKEVMDNKMFEQIAKCAIGFNQRAQGGAVEFDKKFLSYYDEFSVFVVEETDTTVKVRIDVKA